MRLTKLCALIVEDEPNIVESLSFILSRAGYQVRIARDGEQAINALRADSAATAPHIVILDLMLPKRSGLEVLKWLREEPGICTTPVLVLTAKGQPQDRETATHLGADAFISKPFSNKDLVVQVNTLTGHSDGQQSDDRP